jgi:hypothetical protein
VEQKITAAQPVLANLQVQPYADPKSKMNEEGKR